MHYSPVNSLPVQELRKFGFIMAAAFSVLFGVALPLLKSKTSPSWPWIVAAVFFAAALLIPKALGPVYRLWMRFGLVMGAINTFIILTVVFFLSVIPIGLIMRLLGKDSLLLRLDAQTPSYRIKSDPLTRESLERPF